MLGLRGRNGLSVAFEAVGNPSNGRKVEVPASVYHQYRRPFDCDATFFDPQARHVGGLLLTLWLASVTIITLIHATASGRIACKPARSTTKHLSQTREPPKWTEMRSS